MGFKLLTLFNLFVLCVSEPTSSTVSVVWNPNTSHDSASLSCTPEGHRGDSHYNSGCLLRTQIETCWLSSSAVKASRNLYGGDETEDRKGLSWSTYSPRESVKTQDSVENKKFENVSSCRLFGFDLKIPSKADNITSETAPVTPSDVLFHSSMEGQVSAGASDLKSDMSKDCKEQSQLQISPKEVQSKHAATSTRSRTKVHLQSIKL